MEDVEERTKVVVASLLAKIDDRDKEIIRLTTSLDNFRQLVLEHQEEGQALYRKIQDQEQTILNLLRKIKLPVSSGPAVDAPAEISSKNTEISTLKAELTVPPPPVLFVRPPRLRFAASRQSGNFFDAFLDELVGNDESEISYKQISDHLVQLEAAVDIAEIELRHWRSHCRKFLHIQDSSDHD